MMMLDLQATWNPAFELDWAQECGGLERVTSWEQRVNESMDERKVLSIQKELDVVRSTSVGVPT